MLDRERVKLIKSSKKWVKRVSSMIMMMMMMKKRLGIKVIMTFQS